MINLPMVDQRTVSVITFVTLVALINFISIMSQLVLFQLLSCSVFIITLVALEGLFLLMNSAVHLKITQFCELLVASLTLVWFLSFVGSFVNNETAFALINLTAETAVEMSYIDILKGIAFKITGLGNLFVKSELVIN